MSREVGVYDDPHAPRLLPGEDGTPFEDETVVEFASASNPIHFFHERKAAQPSSRIVAYFRAVGFNGAELPRYYPVFCDCDRPVLNSECTRWRPKGGRSNLFGDAAVALGRLPKKGDKLVPAMLFRGKLFKAEIQVVNTDRSGKPLPPSRWHSRLGSLTRLEAGGGPSTSSNPSPQTNSSSYSDSKAFPVTKTSPISTTKDGIEDEY